MCSLMGRTCFYCQRLVRFYRRRGRYIDMMARCRFSGRVVTELCRPEPRRKEDMRHGTV